VQRLNLGSFSVKWISDFKCTLAQSDIPPLLLCQVQMVSSRLHHSSFSGFHWVVLVGSHA
jgi:hypothetical protein